MWFGCAGQVCRPGVVACPTPRPGQPAPIRTAWPGQPPTVFFMQRVTTLGQSVPKRKKLEMGQAHLVTPVFN